MLLNYCIVIANSRELDNILASYLSYKSELEKVNEKKRDLETTKS